MKLLKLLNEKLEMYICITLMSIIAIVLFIQVFMRYVVQASLSWSEELARYLFVWLVYIGISYGAKVMRHIKIDAGLYFFPRAWRRYVVILGDTVFLIFSLVVVYFAWGLVVRQYTIGQLSPAMLIPMWIVYAAPCVGFFLTAIRQVQTIIYRIKHLKDPYEDPAEPDVENL